MVIHSGKTVHLTITNTLGLHARCAAAVAKIAGRAAGEVWLIKDGEKVRADSVLDMLSLFCAQNTAVAFEISNTDDQPLLDEIVCLVNRGFGESTDV